MSVILLGGGGSRVTITHDALEHTIQVYPLDMFKRVQLQPNCTETPLLVTPSTQAWRPFQNYSLQPPPADMWWLLKHVWSTGGQYASYWNTFLYC